MTEENQFKLEGTGNFVKFSGKVCNGKNWESEENPTVWIVIARHPANVILGVYSSQEKAYNFSVNYKKLCSYNKSSFIEIIERELE